MRKFASGSDRVFRGVTLFTFVMSGILIAFMMLVMVGNILGRYFLNQPIPWAVEFSEYFLAITIFLGATWVYKEEAHVNVDVIVQALKPKTRYMLNSVTSWVIAAVLLFITYEGALLTQQHYASNQLLWKTVLTPVWMLDIFIPITALLLFIQSVKRARSFWQRAGKTPDASAK